MHSRHAYKIRMAAREPAQAHQRADHGNVHQFGEFAEFRAGARGNNASAGVNERPLGVPDHLRGAADLAGVPLGVHPVTLQVNRGNRRVVRLGLEDVLRNVHEYGARPSARGQVKGLVNHPRQIRDVLNQVVVLGARARDTEGVRFLEGVAAHQLAVHLAGDGHHRNRVHDGVHQAGGQVGGARAGGGAADSHAAGRAGIAGSGERRVLLVPYQDVADGVIVYRIVERDRDASGVPEETIHALAGQAFQQHPCAAHQVRHSNSLIGLWH